MDKWSWQPCKAKAKHYFNYFYPCKVKKIMIIVNILMVIIKENDVDYENYKFCNSNDD